jgi:hypothetical protein
VYVQLRGDQVLARLELTERGSGGIGSEDRAMFDAVIWGAG